MDAVDVYFRKYVLLYCRVLLSRGIGAFGISVVINGYVN